MSKAKHRVVEIAVAWSGREGDSGEWDTRMVLIPADTPEDQLEQVAVAAYERSMLPQSLDDYQHAWLYWAGDLYEGDDEED